VYSSFILLLGVLEQAPRTTLTPGPKSGVHFTSPRALVLPSRAALAEEGQQQEAFSVSS